MGDVRPHLPRVPTVPQQQRLVLVAVEQLERLPHLRPKDGQVSGERGHPQHGRARPDLPPPAPSRSPDSPPPARPGAAAARARGAACAPGIALHHPPPPPARPHVAAWAPPFCHAALRPRPGPALPAAATQDGAGARPLSGSGRTRFRSAAAAAPEGECWGRDGAAGALPAPWFPAGATGRSLLPVSFPAGAAAGRPWRRT